ncbi:MAG: PUR family DNA/RNA-binding protein [Bacteroidaceae bacterium]|jgi:competence protein ComGC|uniref:DUF3276 family protein n=1 Tax=unclassified Bacteroides TaxID=2646097 RepID=UPI0004E0E9FD|nr:MULTISPECIES: DUF3276 family protein [unclassified Bacteroides]MBP3243774.1 PUR family DNA/RNA-binding protein [Bacteroidaceae bacterium]SDF95293.1 Protein of unknown function [Bacteroidales bacterium KHT7]MBP5220209.1 PUR family DNA/RNA-binding protein [Bacteroidaceae bacterium]MBQ1676595.1 PUR family DNA/RNA-binding protein [Bacteroidaceae bacterium]MBQ2054980.1 PUR family DNA/RNA-binding protein [Bacteroidaceae bacterium]
MDESKKKNGFRESDLDIIASKAIKAGKRIYYMDVKKNRRDEMFLAITESKKVITGEGESAQVNFEKHKIFIYKEDFEKFKNGLNELIKYIEERQGACPSRESDKDNGVAEAKTAENAANDNPLSDEIKIDIDF